MIHYFSQIRDVMEPRLNLPFHVTLFKFPLEGASDLQRFKTLAPCFCLVCRFRSSHTLPDVSAVSVCFRDRLESLRLYCGCIFEREMR